MFFRKRQFKIYKKYSEYTMIPYDIFSDNILLCIEHKKVKGSVVECGVWKGGMIAAIAETLNDDREYYLFDSFEGLPKAEQIDGENALNWQKKADSKWYFDNCKTEEGFAIKAMEIANTTNYKIIKGWFNHTIPSYNFEEQIAILRLDGDWYDSTLICLENLFPKVAQGGIIIIDDYYVWDGCSKAVHDYLSKNQLAFRIKSTKNNVCYILK